MNEDQYLITVRPTLDQNSEKRNPLVIRNNYRPKIYSASSTKKLKPFTPAVGSGLAAAFVFIIIVIITLCICKRKKKQKIKAEEEAKTNRKSEPDKRYYAAPEPIPNPFAVNENNNYNSFPNNSELQDLNQDNYNYSPPGYPSPYYNDNVNNSNNNYQQGNKINPYD